MELIKISQSKLKIMLNAEDMKHYDLDDGRMRDISCRAAFRNILKEARERCGFDAACDKVFVQYYPEKNGGCEMYVTKLGESVWSKYEGSADKKEQAKLASRSGSERYDSGYIIYSFRGVSELLSTCRSLKNAGYAEESRAYRIKDKCRYYLVLTSETYHAAENNGTRCEGSYYYVLTEHGELLCVDAVDKLAALA